MLGYTIVHSKAELKA